MKPLPFRKFLLTPLSALIVAGAALGTGYAQTTKEDSGWVSLFNGRNFDGFYTYFENKGIIDLAAQDAFYVDSGMIHVRKKKSSGLSTAEGHLITIKQYSWYKIRLDYRFERAPIDNNNAGLVIHIDSNQAWVQKVTGLRPRSIEINMNRADNYPWTLWSATKLGPYITTTVQSGTNKYLAKKDGGVEWTNDPWAERIIHSSYPNPESPFGEWNHGEAEVYGDSMGIFKLNGKVRVVGWNFRDRKNPNDASMANRVPVDHGEIGVQSERQEIWYKNFEIMELEPHTLKPLHAKPTAIAPSSRKFTQPAAPGNRVFTFDGKRIRSVPGKSGSPAASPVLPAPE